MDYSERLLPTDPHWPSYAKFLAAHHAALMPTFSLYYTRLPDYRNLWKEPQPRRWIRHTCSRPPIAPRAN